MMQIKNKEKISFIEVENWYEKVRSDCHVSFLSEEDQAYVVSKNRNASESILINPAKSAYFKHAFVMPFWEMAKFFFKDTKRPHLLDLGAGVGTQSLFFAMCGASVTAIDMDKRALEILEKRRKHYESELGKTLDITCVCANTVTFDYSTVPRFDGVYSLFAFNLMKPVDQLLQKLTSHLAPLGKVAILDGNVSSLMNQLMPSRKREALSPSELGTSLQDLDLRIVDQKGQMVLPSVFWKETLTWPMKVVNATLRLGNWKFPYSHLLLAEKNEKN
ncbi:MAG: 2-polyprenyl-3-methyl-5-hydroxy-6-metoxy-1,4-benzoquinol methylase [Candidatus Marinamargulisbacteria bacterium]|jgi:2-polyprenyl-3-methyl-5-hydroxy-6-metoxy-1,4-benzoquinol methylase